MIWRVSELNVFHRLNLAESKVWEEAGRTGYLAFLPLLFGLSIANEFLTFAPIYFYSGEGWWKSAVTVFVERSLKVYLVALTSKIMKHVWSFSSLLNEVF